MKINELNKAKIPLVKINPELSTFSKKILFQNKLEKANKRLEKIQLPRFEKEYDR